MKGIITSTLLCVAGLATWAQAQTASHVIANGHIVRFLKEKLLQ